MILILNIFWIFNITYVKIEHIKTFEENQESAQWSPGPTPGDAQPVSSVLKPSSGATTAIPAAQGPPGTGTRWCWGSNSGHSSCLTSALGTVSLALGGFCRLSRITRKQLTNMSRLKFKKNWLKILQAK